MQLNILEGSHGALEGPFSYLTGHSDAGIVPATPYIHRMGGHCRPGLAGQGIGVQAAAGVPATVYV